MAEIDASAGYTYNRGNLSGIGTSEGWSAGFTTSFFQAGLDASWELDFFGGIRRNVEAAEADVHAAVEDRRDVMVTLLGDIGTNYMNLRCFQQQIEIARSNLKSQRHTVETTRKKHQAGLVSALHLAMPVRRWLSQNHKYQLWNCRHARNLRISILLAREPAAS